MSADRVSAEADAPRTRPQATQVRRRIIEAGADLLLGFPVWNWTALTVPAVAERAGVAERTVYRHFQSERGLRDAVMLHMEQAAKVSLTDLRLEDVPQVASRIFEHSSQYPTVPRTPRDPTVASTQARQREALLAAVEPHTRTWSAKERTIAAAMLDVLWSVVGYERLVSDWSLEPQEAIRGTTWVIRLVEEAIRSQRRPGRTDP